MMKYQPVLLLLELFVVAAVATGGIRKCIKDETGWTFCGSLVEHQPTTLQDIDSNTSRGGSGIGGKCRMDYNLTCVADLQNGGKLVCGPVAGHLSTTRIGECSEQPPPPPLPPTPIKNSRVHVDLGHAKPIVIVENGPQSTSTSEKPPQNVPGSFPTSVSGPLVTMECDLNTLRNPLPGYSLRELTQSSNAPNTNPLPPANSIVDPPKHLNLPPPPPPYNASPRTFRDYAPLKPQNPAPVPSMMEKLVENSRNRKISVTLQKPDELLSVGNIELGKPTKQLQNVLPTQMKKIKETFNIEEEVRKVEEIAALRMKVKATPASTDFSSSGQFLAYVT